MNYKKKNYSSEMCFPTLSLLSIFMFLCFIGRIYKTNGYHDHLCFLNEIKADYILSNGLSTYYTMNSYWIREHAKATVESQGIKISISMPWNYFKFLSKHSLLGVSICALFISHHATAYPFTQANDEQAEKEDQSTEMLIVQIHETDIIMCIIKQFNGI